VVIDLVATELAVRFRGVHGQHWSLALLYLSEQQGNGKMACPFGSRAKLSLFENSILNRLH
jgi:hypothetical protein